MERIGERIVSWANWTIRIVGSLIFLILTWYALRYTQYMVPMQGYEYPVDRKDSEILNLLAAVLFCAIIYGLMKAEKVIPQKVRLGIQRTALVLSMAWQGVCGYLWITAADRCPKGDQESVFKSAAGFLAGDYHALKKGAYCGLYPHQLGLAALEEAVFRIVGKADFYVLQLLFVLMIVGTVFCVYKLLTELTDHMGVIVSGTLLSGACLLPVFYSCWVYGEVPYVFFAMLAAWMLVRYAGRRAKGSLAIFLVAVTFAVLVRKNALILVVAFALVAAVYGIGRKDRKIVIPILLAFLIPTMLYEGIFRMYELRSGIEHSEGLPSNDFVYIGLVETEGGRYGWDFYPSTQVYYDNEKDPQKTEAAVNRLIAERWQEMKSQPGYLQTFYKGKILSQWNAPLYQAVYFNYVHEEVRYPRITEFLDRLSGEYFSKVLWTADRMQFIVYFGMLLYFVFAVRRDSNPLQHMLAVTIIGGFLFSILWEAKTRYIFPYYMMMFPMAVFGYQEMLGKLIDIVGKAKVKHKISRYKR